MLENNLSSLKSYVLCPTAPAVSELNSKFLEFSNKLSIQLKGIWLIICFQDLILIRFVVVVIVSLFLFCFVFCYLGGGGGGRGSKLHCYL